MVPLLGLLDIRLASSAISGSYDELVDLASLLVCILTTTIGLCTLQVMVAVYVVR
jgi:hypothetical protein